MMGLFNKILLFTFLVLFAIVVGEVIFLIFLNNRLANNTAISSLKPTFTPPTSSKQTPDVPFQEKINRIVKDASVTNYIVQINEGIINAAFNHTEEEDGNKSVGDCINIQLVNSSIQKSCFFSKREYYKSTNGVISPSDFKSLKAGDTIVIVVYLHLMYDLDVQPIKTIIYFGDETTKTVSKAFN